MVPEYDLARRVLWNLSFSVDKDSIQSNVWTIKWICTRTIQEVINRIQQGIQQMIEKMLHKHRTPEEIADFCDCDLREVEAVQEKMQKGSR